MRLRRREHHHYIDALETLKVFERTHSFGKPEIHEQPELYWHQGDERRNWQDYQSFLGNMTVSGTVEPSNMKVVDAQHEPISILKLVPDQRQPDVIKLSVEELAS